jgi:hypothetical protein
MLVRENGKTAIEADADPELLDNNSLTLEALADIISDMLSSTGALRRCNQRVIKVFKV